MNIDMEQIAEFSDAELSDLLHILKATTMNINYDDVNVENEESLKRIFEVVNDELKGITSHYERKFRIQNRWISALFMMLKDAGVEPSSKDIMNALRRIDENAKHSSS